MRWTSSNGVELMPVSDARDLGHDRADPILWDAPAIPSRRPRALPSARGARPAVVRRSRFTSPTHREPVIFHEEHAVPTGQNVDTPRARIAPARCQAPAGHQPQRRARGVAHSQQPAAVAVSLS